MTDRNYLDCKDDDYLSCGDDYLSCVDEPVVVPPVDVEPSPVTPPNEQPRPTPRKDDDFIYETFFKAFIIIHYLIDKVKGFFKKKR